MVAVGNVHNTRILRFIIVIIAVILTIFIYASYSTTSTLTPQHMRVVGVPLPAANGQMLENRSNDINLPQIIIDGNRLHQRHQQLQQQQSHNNNEPQMIRNSTKIMQHNMIAGHGASSAATYKKPQHRAPTIDADALRDGGAAGTDNAAAGQKLNANHDDLGNDEMTNEIDDAPDEIAMNQLNGGNELDEQYGQNVENLIGNLNNTASDVIAQIPIKPVNQQPQTGNDGEILIPTSNLQKFIENADKILKNITNSSSPSAANVIEQQKQQQQQQQDKAAAAVSPPSEHQQQQKQQQQKLVEHAIMEEGGPLPPSVIMHIVGASSGVGAKEAVNSQPKNVKPTPIKIINNIKKGNNNIPLDPSKGILTENIYESGHMNEEIDVERICPKRGGDLKLLVLITSAQTHVEARLAIRQTWAHYGTRRDVSTAFILGRTTNDSINKMLEQENFIYGDLIRGNFIDSYNNLTLKTISSLEWVDQHCSEAKYILKTDDDMFINIPKLLAFIDKHKDKRVIYGRLAKKWKPIRNKKSKYYVSSGQFPASVFPAFTTGPAYVLTSDIVHDLYVRSLETVYLKLEDVFTTGIVAQALGIKRVHVNEFLNRRISFNPCNIRNAISVHMIKSNEQFDLWKKLLDQTTKCK